jgi:acyl transferase domain-containing protein
VNSFGYGGTNAHVIIEDTKSYLDSHYPSKNRITNGIQNGISSCSIGGNANGVAITNGTKSNGSLLTSLSIRSPNQNRLPVALNHQSRVFTLSSFNKAASKAQAQNLLTYLQEAVISTTEDFLDNLAFTLNSRRSRFPWRLAISAPSVDGLKEAIASSELEFSQAPSTVPRLGFVFTGQGAQWYAMGRELFDRYPIYRESITKADGCLKKLGAEWSLIGGRLLHYLIVKVIVL